MTRPDSNNHKKRVGAVPWCHPGHQGTPVGPGMDTHGTPVPEREGCGWPTTRATNVHNQKTDTTVFTNVHGSGAVLSPASSARVQQRTEQVVQRRQEVDGQFVGSRKQQRQRTQGNTPGLRTRFKSEEFIDKIQNEIVHLVEDEQCPAQNPRNTSTQWR